MIDKQKILELCSGNKDAAGLIVDLWGLFCVWDDCVDKDKETQPESINNAFMWAMFGLHSSPFFIENAKVLKPAIYSCIASWLTANKFEKSGDVNLLHRSFVMRCSPYELFGVIVLLAAGFSNQCQAIEYFQSLNTDDKLDSYLSEHKGA